MSFKLMEAFIDITAPTQKAFAGVDAVKTKLGTVPAQKTIEVKLDETGVDTGIASVKEKLGKLDKKGRLRDEHGRFIGTGNGGESGGGGGGLSLAFGRMGLGGGGGGAGSALAGATAGLASAGAMMAVPALVSTLREGVMGASNLAETVSKVEVIFGDASVKVKDFAGSMAEAFGSNRTEILDAAAGFGLLGKAAGQSQEEAAGFSVVMAKLADDASSFYNVPLTEALTTIKSALVGEAEPIRRFGVLLNEGAVKAEAYRLGVAKVGAELTEGQKVAARSSLIQKGLADATGDHARTAGSFANQWREFTGRMYEFSTTIGSIALPALNGILAVINPVAQGAQMIAKGFADATAAVRNFAGSGYNALFGSRWGSGDVAVPGAGAGKALPPAGADQGVAGGLHAAKFGMDAARKHVADETAKDEQDLLIKKAKDEKSDADRKAANDRTDQAMFKFNFIQRQRGFLNQQTIDKQHFNAGMTDAQKQAELDKNQGRAEKLFENKFGGKPLPADARADSTEARNTIEGLKSMFKDLAPQASGLFAQAKQNVLGLTAKGINTIDAAGEGERIRKANEKERKFQIQDERKNFQSQIFRSGEDLYNAAQVANLTKKTDDPGAKQQAEIAKNTALAAKELQGGFAKLIDTIKQLPQLGVVLK